MRSGSRAFRAEHEKGIPSATVTTSSVTVHMNSSLILLYHFVPHGLLSNKMMVGDNNSTYHFGLLLGKYVPDKKKLTMLAIIIMVY